MNNFMKWRSCIMNKYAVRYCEILAKTIIAEADTYEEAEEKVQAAVDDCRTEKLI